MWGWFLSETPKTSPKDDGFGLGGDFVFEKHKERTCNDMCAKDIYIVNILNYEDIYLSLYIYICTCTCMWHASQYQMYPRL